MLGAVLEGFPPGSPGAKQLGGVYRVCGEHAGLPRFQGAEAHNGAAHMYRYRPGAGDSWFVNTEFAPENNMCCAKVLPLPGGAVPEHGRAGVQWSVWSTWLDLPQKGGKNYWVNDQPLVLTALVRSPSLSHPSPLSGEEHEVAREAPDIGLGILGTCNLIRNSLGCLFRG
eukprot:COSAG01_NODE_9270_length_2496_cov_34.599082_1_plen_170_part_00